MVTELDNIEEKTQFQDTQQTDKLYASMCDDVDTLKSEIIRLKERDKKMIQTIDSYKEKIQFYQQLVTKLRINVESKNQQIIDLKSKLIKLDDKLNDIIQPQRQLSAHKLQSALKKDLNQHQRNNLKLQRKSLQIQEQNAISALKGHEKLKSVLNEQLKLMQNNLQTILNQCSQKRVKAEQKKR